MSFSATRKRALDATRHINSRRVAVRTCIERCLIYSKPVGYAQLVRSFTQTHNLNRDNLSDQDIKDILAELTELRHRSIDLTKRFQQYRANQKANGYQQISKKDENYRKQIQTEI